MAAASGGPAAPSLRLVASDELGMLRAAQVPEGLRWDSFAIVQEWGRPNREFAVRSLCAYSTSIEPGEDCLLAVSRPGGTIDVLDGYTGDVLGTCNTHGTHADVAGLAFFRPAQYDSRRPTLVAVTTAGGASLYVQRDEAGHGRWHSEAAFQTVEAVSALALDGTQARMALGGEGCHVALWDLATQQQTWQAKGSKPNRAGLVDKPHITALACLPERTPPWVGAGREPCMLVGTAGHKLLLYDPGSGRRPQLELDWGDARVTAMTLARDGLGVWVANAKGMLDLLDLRTRKMSCALKGTTGSIRALSLHPRQDVIASVGLDRFLRIHDTKSRCCVAKLYLKQQLTGVAWLPPSLGIPGCWGDTGPAQTDDGVADYGGGKRNPSSRHELPGKPKRTRR